MAHQPPPKRDDPLLDDDDDDDDDELLDAPRNPYASRNRWRHQESTAFARHAAAQQQQPRDPEPRGRTNDLASFLNSSRVPADERQSSKDGPPRKSTPIMVAAPEAREAVHAAESGAGGLPKHDEEGHVRVALDGRDIAVGPLLNYRRTEGGRWVGSVLVVTQGGGKRQLFEPTLLLRRADRAEETHGAASPIDEVNGAPLATTDGVNGSSSAVARPSRDSGGGTEVRALCLYSDPRNTFWRFDLSVPIEEHEAKWAYTLPGLRFHSKKKPQTSVFSVAAASESMRVMFHSCNGFSVGTDEDDFSGPALWHDVLRRHGEKPFHVMIGGGDQIYNDSIRVSGPLRKWADIGNPNKRRQHAFPESLRQACDDFYLKNYIRWYGTEPFASANGHIPQLNIWDDHDIIDGFGSYVNEFMKCDVFRGIGGTAHKYYMLFQHHLAPPPSTYTSDAPQTAATDPEEKDVDPIQLQDTYVADRIIESNYIIGPKPGPYVVEHSHNMFAKLGARVAFLGIDARTERTRHQINYPETYDLIFSRLSDELRAAKEAGTPFKHLILLLGIPIAYPRLTWLENIFSSPIMGPVKFLNRRFGLGGGFFNYFDGSVDLLDDLDDHYTARTHKKERNALVERLQVVCGEFSVRITILGGDVHLAAMGRFYSNPKLGVPTENDHRYMANIVSSAITNKPPPQAIANLLARRNKIHHLNHDTDETLLKLFDKDPGDSSKTAGHNHVTMPSRNYAIITENSPNNPEPPAAAADDRDGAAPATNGTAPEPPASGGSNGHASSTSSGSATGKDGHYPLHAGERHAGTRHRAAAPETHGTGRDGSLDVCIRVEIDQHDRRGHTQGYGLTIPALDYVAPDPPAAAAHRLPHLHLRHKASGAAGTGATVPRDAPPPVADAPRVAEEREVGVAR